MKFFAQSFIKNFGRSLPVLTFAPLLIGFTIIATPAWSQTEGLVMEEVMVTATKREPPLMETGISISAFSSEKLQEFGLDDRNRHQDPACQRHLQRRNDQKTAPVFGEKRKPQQGPVYDATLLRAQILEDRRLPHEEDDRKREQHTIDHEMCDAPPGVRLAHEAR